MIARQKTTHPSILAALEDARLEPNAECDLHGMTVSQSDAAVLRFVRNHQGRGDRWVLIIVGKGTHSPGGRSTLRDSVIEALSRGEASRFVLAFRTAPRVLGGTGALAVRLVDRTGPDR